MGESESPEKTHASSSSWQLRKDPPSEIERDTSTVPSTSASRAELLEQAAKFLEDDEIRNAPKERKVSFLESKGLRKDEVEMLISPPLKPVEVAAPSTTRAPTLQPPPLPSATKPVLPVQSEQKPDAPPIVTYPEFMAPYPGPPPLITVRRLLSALYIGGATAASIYAASKYIIAPMTSQLTEARHSLAKSALADLKKLNEKLESAVSKLPAGGQKQLSGLDDYEDADSIDSDPTEMFHIDVGTQTSPVQSRRSSIFSSTSNDIKDKDAMIIKQEDSLKSIHTQLAGCLDSSSAASEESSTVLFGLQDLKTYLDGLSYSSPYYSASNVYGGVISGSGLGGVGAVRSSDTDDAIAKVKSEIRGIKGVLLSARNFPTSNPRPGGMAARVGTH